VGDKVVTGRRSSGGGFALALASHLVDEVGHKRDTESRAGILAMLRAAPRR
jgi:hypothetical protein